MRGGRGGVRHEWMDQGRNSRRGYIVLLTVGGEPDSQPKTTNWADLPPYLAGGFPCFAAHHPVSERAAASGVRTISVIIGLLRTLPSWQMSSWSAPNGATRAK